MINKIMKRGKSIGGLVRYLFGPGEANEHTGQRIIAADAVLGLADGTRLDQPQDRERLLQLGRDLDAHRLLASVAPARGWVWHCAISLRSGERLTDIQWAQAARTVVERLKFTSDPTTGRAACRWIAVHHGPGKEGNDHIHLAVNLVREDGTIAAPGLDRKLMSGICADLETRYGLSVEEGRATGGLPSITRAETARVSRRERTEPDRLTLARHVRAAELLADGEAGFVAELVTSGVLLQPRWGPGKTSVTGYSVALPPVPGAKPVWYGGGKLAPDLTLPRLRSSWTDNAPSSAVSAWTAAAAGQPVAPPLTTSVLTEWRTAATQVDALAEQLERTPSTDTLTWARAAREAAATYAVLWARIESTQPGPLAGAADALARSAQTRHHKRGDTYYRPLRSTARAVRSTPVGSGERSSNALVRLIKALVRLTKLIYDVHRARAQTQRAVELARASQAQLARIQHRTTRPNVLADSELAEVATAIDYLNAVQPQELLRRGSRLQSSAWPPLPSQRGSEHGLDR